MPHSLIVDNPYRVLGTCTAVSNQTIFANYRSLMARSLKGIDSALGQDMSNFLPQPLRTPYRLDQAKLKLGSAKGRLYHALFWFIDTNKIDHAALYYLSQGERDKAMKILISTPAFSSYMNLAVLALSEDRFKDAMQYYSQLFQDETMTQQFISAVIGEQYRIKGVFILSKIAAAIDEEQRRKESEESSDERSFAGSGYGVLNKESQNKIRLTNHTPEVMGINHLQLRRQTNRFDRHLSESFEQLLAKIGQINHEYGVDEDADFVEVDLALTPAAKLALGELQRFFDLNYALIEAFKNRCLEIKEKSLYLDYIYNLVSLTHYVFHLYIIDFGRMYSPALVQQLRSLTIKLERLYFRMKSDDLDYMIASLKRVEDSLPFIYQIAQAFEKYYVMQDPATMVKNFYAFHRESLKALESFAQTYGLGGVYVDCSLHLQDMLVRFNVTFMSSMTGLALQFSSQPKELKNLVAVQKAMALQEAQAQQKASQQSQEQRLSKIKAKEQEDQEALDRTLPDLYTSSQRPPYVAPPIDLVDKYGQDDADNDSAATVTTSNSANANDPSNQAKPQGKLPVNTVGNTWVQNAQAQGEVKLHGQQELSPKQEKARLKAQAKAQAQALKEQERIRKMEQQRASRLMRQRLSKERGKLMAMLNRFEAYSVAPNTMFLIRVVKQQVERLPPPTNLKTVGGCILLLAITAGIVYLDYWLSNMSVS